VAQKGHYVNISIIVSLNTTSNCYPASTAVASSQGGNSSINFSLSVNFLLVKKLSYKNTKFGELRGKKL